MFIVSVSLVILVMTTKIHLDVINVFLKPAIAGLACSIVSKTSYNILYMLLPSKYVLIPAIILGGIIYFMTLFALKAITRADIELLPNGKKLAKTLIRKRYIY